MPPETATPDDGSPDAAASALRVLLIGPSLRIMGGQAVQAEQLYLRMREDGLDIEFLPINPKPPGPLALAERVKGLRTLVVSFFYVVSLLRRVRRFDVVHLFSASYLSFLIAQMPAILVARLYRKPVILNYRSGEADDHLTHASPLVFALLRSCAHIAVPSGYLVEVFGRHGFAATAIPNIVDAQAFRYRERERALPRIVVPRSLEALYNVACAIRAFARIRSEIPDAQLTILGDGAQRAELEALVAELDLEGVAFTGRVERDRIGEIYDAHDVLVNTSSIDNMPVSLLEGFAAGLPIVSTDAGGIPFIVSDGENGRLAPIDDDAAIAEHVLALVRQPEEVLRLSRAGADEARKYRWPQVARQWLALYARVVREHGAQPAASGAPT